MSIFGKKEERPVGTVEPVITTREYRLYKEMEEKKKSWYEVLNGLAAKTLHVKASGSIKEEIERSAAFTGLSVTGDSVMSLMVLTIIGFIVIGVVTMAAGVTPIGGIMVIALGMLVAYYLLKYPSNLVKTYRIKASSQVVLAILYMVVSMRISPNLERALRFAALNVSGELAWDMRKLLWDIEMRKYYSASEALDDYMVRWKAENGEFAESLRLIRNSQAHPPERAKGMLDEALNVVLDGTRTRMKHYAQDLKMPVMVIHMMGIILPVLGTIMAPLAAVFLSNLVSPWHFVLGYDIILPIVIIWFINNTLNKRPATFSQVDISKHPDLPAEGRMRIGKADLPVWPIALLIVFALAIGPIIYFSMNPELLFPQIDEKTGKPVVTDDPNSVMTLTVSMFAIIGVGFGIAAFFLLSTFQRTKIQNSVQKIESEFELALFQLGNRIAGGVPTEVAIEKSLDDMKDLEIAGLFRHTLRNIKALGLTFEAALFDKQWGALKYYPSKLLENIMYTVVDTAKKGVQYASEGMLRIASYLKSIRETQEYIREILSDTVGSMKFQAYFLTPMITGLIVSMTEVIVKVLVKLGAYLKTVTASGPLPVNFSLMEFGAPSLTPPAFQFIVGIYLIEIIFILALFITKIEKGEDSVALGSNVGKMLLVGVIFYALIAVASSTMFSGLIEDALSGLGILG